MQIIRHGLPVRSAHRAAFAIVPAFLALLFHSQAADNEANTPNGSTLQPVYRVKGPDGKERLTPDASAESTNAKSAAQGIAFLAVTAAVWPNGHVPVFGIEKNGQFELRRRPVGGQENSTEPLFFALPLADEAESAKIAGRWWCTATNVDGSKHYPTLELAIEDAHVAGRFDQGTDYRVASLTGGTFRSNRVELTVEYVTDRYTLSGEWRDGGLTGTWQRADDGARGTWEASRVSSTTVVETTAEAVPLFEWRRASDGARRYSMEANLNEPGWERAQRPLCRVWRSPGRPGTSPSI